MQSWYSPSSLLPSPIPQGLGDEAMDVEDDDDDDDELAGVGEEDEEGEAPIFSSSSGATHPPSQQQHHQSASSSASGRAAYGYKDVFGKEYERRRQQQIEAKVGA